MLRPMGKTIFAAVVAAVLAAVATVLVMDSVRNETVAAAEAARKLEEDTRRVEQERLERRLKEVETRVATAPRVERRPAAEDRDAAAQGAPPPALAPDGTPYVSRAELEAFAKEREIARAATLDAAGAVAPQEKLTLEEIAREQGLSAGEEANLRNILRESEEELVRCLFGDTPLDDVKRQVKEADEDPDKLTALMQGVVQNGIANVGRLMTLEKRTNKKVEAVLGEERAKKFLATPRVPVIDPEFEKVFEDFGD